MQEQTKRPARTVRFSGEAVPRALDRGCSPAGVHPSLPRLSFLPLALLVTVACGRTAPPPPDPPEDGQSRVTAEPAVAPDAAAATRETASLCGADERVFFSCTTIRDGRLISLCAARGLDERRGYLQYRFGSPGAVELEFPAERRHPRGSFEYSRYTRPRVTYLSIEFDVERLRFSLRQESDHDQEPPVQESALTVSERDRGADARPVAEHRCREPVQGSLMELEEILHEPAGEPL